MSNEPQYNITVLYGHKELERLKFKLLRLPRGQGRIVGDFMMVDGSYRDLLENVHLLGGDVEFVDAALDNPSQITPDQAGS